MSDGRDVSGLSFTVCRSEESAFQRQTENDKPQTTLPRAFLADFGLAKSVATGSKLTRTGEALGTPAYMSPEQARGEVSALTPATDVWSLGCVLYEMLAGRAPFEGETAAAVVGQVLLREPPALHALRPETPQGVERVVRVCLGKRAADRYRDARALRADLERLLEGQRPRARLPGARRRVLVTLVTAGTAAVIVPAFVPGGGGKGREEGAVPSPRADRGTVEAPAVSPAERLAARAAGLRSTNPRGAAALLAEALRAAPERHDLRLERGVMLWGAGDGVSAREEWDLVVRSSPGASATRARLLLGLEALFRLEGGELRGDEALPYLESLREAPGQEGGLARGALRMRAGHWSGARELLRDAEGWEAALLRAFLEDSDPAGDRDRVLRSYGEALEKGIAFGWVYSNRGIARAESGDLVGAIADFDAALALAPRYKEAINNRAYAKRALGRLAEAIADFDAALALDPRYMDALINRGAAKGASGDFGGAIADADTALALDPTAPEAYAIRGVARLRLGEPAAAAADLEKALEVGASNWPDRPATERDLARARAALAGGGAERPK